MYRLYFFNAVCQLSIKYVGVMFCSNLIFILPHILSVLEQINVVMVLTSILLRFKLINIHYHIKRQNWMLTLYRKLVDQHSHEPPFPTVFL